MAPLVLAHTASCFHQREPVLATEHHPLCQVPHPFTTVSAEDVTQVRQGHRHEEE